MLCWDDVFRDSCEVRPLQKQVYMRRPHKQSEGLAAERQMVTLQDPERASELFETAQNVYSKHGRGCVMVAAHLKSKFMGAGRGGSVARQRAQASAHQPLCDDDIIENCPNLMQNSLFAFVLLMPQC